MVTTCAQSQRRGRIRVSSFSSPHMELYSMMGFGFDNFGYFTYQPDFLEFTQNSTFVNIEGECTNVYYYGQEAIANAQAMSDVILNYEFLGSKFYTKKIPTFDVSCYFSGPSSFVQVKRDNGKIDSISSSLTFDNSHEFQLIKDIQFDNDVVYVSELKDSVNDLYMYMVQNVINPQNGGDGRTAENVAVDFGSEYTYVAELKDGKINYVKLNSGVYERTISAGHAVYLIPLK